MKVPSPSAFPNPQSRRRRLQKAIPTAKKVNHRKLMSHPARKSFRFGATAGRDRSSVPRGAAKDIEVIYPLWDPRIHPGDYPILVLPQVKIFDPKNHCLPQKICLKYSSLFINTDDSLSGGTSPFYIQHSDNYPTQMWEGAFGQFKRSLPGRL